MTVETFVKPPANQPRLELAESFVIVKPRLFPMTWRQKFLLHFGPGMLAGITFSQWAKLLRKEATTSLRPDYRAFLPSLPKVSKTVCC
jgi:hypothetical protein